MWHDGPIGGHSGVYVTYKKLKAVVYWKHTKTDIASYLAACHFCQRHKPDNTAYPGLLQPFPIPQRIWTDISMDFIEGLPSSHRKQAILVVGDSLSKYAHFVALSHPYTAHTVAQCFMDQI